MQLRVLWVFLRPGFRVFPNFVAGLQVLVPQSPPLSIGVSHISISSPLSVIPTLTFGPHHHPTLSVGPFKTDKRPIIDIIG